MTMFLTSENWRDEHRNVRQATQHYLYLTWHHIEVSLRLTVMFQNAHNVTINGGSFTNVNEQFHGMTGLHILYRGASQGATHDSVEHAPICHPETRKTIVSDIMSWIEDPFRTSSVLWFNGPAGAGKTAIANTLSERCTAKQWLAGSYFFSRLAAGRNDPTRLFPTIAYQLSLTIPVVGKVIEEVVANDPAVVAKKLEIQLQKLIVEPLKQVSDLPVQPIVILIDGLDECENEDVQCDVLRLLGSVFQHPSVGGLAHICFIITSRPDPWIRDEFSIEPLSRITRQMFLGQTAEANDDIRTFLRIGFTEIHDSPKHRLTMSNVAKPWPSYRVLDDLVERASGQFIYPATVLKFVGDPNDRPTDRLRIVTSIPAMAVSASTLNPLAALDQLYSQILSTTSDKQRTLDVLGAIIAIQGAWSGLYSEWVPHVEDLRVVERLLGLQLGDGPLALRMTHSLVHITVRSMISDIPDDNLLPPEDLQIYFCDEDGIRFHHKSFIDYLMDPSRSLECFVDIKQMNAQLALACMVSMQTFSLQSVSRIACVTWGYATLCWTHHVIQSGIPQQTLLEALVRFNVLGCYVDTLSLELEGKCRRAIERVAFPKGPATVIAWITEKLSPTKDIIDQTRPNPCDIEVARGFLLLSGAHNDSTQFHYSRRLQKVVDWMQTNPDSPLELIGQYQVLANILNDYSRSPGHMSDDNCRRNARKTARPSIINWINMKELLKRRT